MSYNMQPPSPHLISRSFATAAATRWRLTGAAAAVAAVLAFGATDANALALGRIKVLSALGEPLRAEIDIPEISPAEIESLRASPASPETFRAAGLEFDSVISSVRIAVQQRANGRPFLRLTSNRPVSDPFMDFIVNVTSSSGRISRDYTMLFDPQGGRGSAPAVIPPAAQAIARQGAAVAAAREAPAGDAANGGASETAPAAVPSRTARAARSRVTPAPAAANGDAAAQQLKVRPGDTASRIAAAHLPADVSLDQMLVALLRSNPSAFINGNVNRIKAGAVLELPDSAAKVAELAGAEPGQTLTAQSRDFNAYRRKLASAAAPAQIAAADRSDSGRLQADVQERAAASASPDKLTLSKGSIDARAPTGGAQPAAASAQSTEAAPAARSDGSGAAEPSPVQSAANTINAGSAVAPAATAVVGAASGTPGAAGTAGSTGSLPNIPGAIAATRAAASEATAAAAAATPQAAPSAASEPGLVDRMLEEPLLPALGLGLIGLLAGLGFYRSRRRREAEASDSALAGLDSQSESMFSLAGGRSIDTLHGSTGVASIGYSASQLDAGGEVDPVAEADVYLAYGREEQALEILKEALRTEPARTDVRVKLLEVHARRHEIRAFEALAAETRPLVGDDSRDWRRICDLGRELDSGNPLYRLALPQQAGTGMPAAHAAEASPQTGPAAAVAASAAVALPLASATPKAKAAWHDPGADLDIDFGAPADNAPVPALSDSALDLDFSDFGRLEPTSASSPSVRGAGHADLEAADSLPSHRFDPSAVEPPAASAPKVEPVSKSGMIDFDFGSLRLDLDEPPELREPAAAQPSPPAPGPTRTAAAQPSAAHAGVDDGDALSTKLALAEAFSAIGDVDGARSLAHEVIGESSGTLKAKAQRFLASIH